MLEFRPIARSRRSVDVHLIVARYRARDISGSTDRRPLGTRRRGGAAIQARARTVRRRDDRLSFVRAPRPGDFVSLHWDFVCDVLSPAAPRARARDQGALRAVNDAAVGSAVLA